MKTICIKAKIKKNAITEVRKWFQELKKREDEVLKTLENEEVLIESVFLENHGDDNYLIYYMRAKDIAHAHRIYKESTLSIDLFHKECWKNFCEKGESLEILLDLDRIDYDVSNKKI